MSERRASEGGDEGASGFRAGRKLVAGGLAMVRVAYRDVSGREDGRRVV